MNLNKIFAKSNGITLIEHSKNVSDISVKILNKTIKHITQERTDIVRLGGLLHDIGKCTSDFQKKTLADKKSNSKFRHNEIGWAFLYEYLNIPETDKLNQILDIVYWHHGISNRMSESTHVEILETISDDDIKIMKSMIVHLLGESYLIPNGRSSNIWKKTPKYYEDFEDINEVIKRVINRTCLISGDRLSSRLEENKSLGKADSEINEIILSNTNMCFDNFPYSDLKRFNRQIDIANSCDKTTIVKAPAGFGKTLIGLLWSSLSNKKLIWVCPTNAISLSVYKSVLSELEAFGIDLGVELYLGGETKERNYKSDLEFNSDIIITNIDSFLAPTVNSRNADRLFLINTADVVFDEYHEMVGDAALFSGFVNIMNLRHNYSECRTMLLSATPISVEYLWDTIGNNTLVLPNKNQHFNAVHTKKYRINIIKDLPKVVGSSNLTILNTISESQKKYDKNTEELIHSSFTKAEKIKKIEGILKRYGKNSNINLNQGNIVSSPIVQSSMDISFENLFESVLSPETTMQRIGRIDRWGNLPIAPSINIARIADSHSENKIKEIIYSKELSDLWYEYIKQYDKNDLTLDQLYEIYNSFSISNEKLIKKLVREKYNKSKGAFENIYPIKYHSQGKNKDIITAGSNKLRSSSNEIFFIVKIHGSKEYSDPFSTKIYNSIDKDFGETKKTLAQVKGVMRKLRKDERFSYEEVLSNKNITLDLLRRYGKRSNTPYVRFDMVYHPTYGLIDENLLDKLLDM